MKVLITDKKNDEHSIEYTVGDSLAETIMYSTIGDRCSTICYLWI